MAFWIQGWMEVTTDDPDASDAIWQGVVDLGVLIDTSDDFSELMFGLTKSYRSDQHKRKTSLFADRGLPEVPSAGLADARKRDEPFIKTGEIGGYTYASLAEIRSAMPPERVETGTGPVITSRVFLESIPVRTFLTISADPSHAMLSQGGFGCHGVEWP